MSAGEFVLGVVRLGAIVLPAGWAAHRLRAAYLPLASRAVAAVAEIVVAISLVLVGAEVLGLVSADGVGGLVGLLVLVAVICHVLTRGRSSGAASPTTGGGEEGSATRGESAGARRDGSARSSRDVGFFCAASGVAIVAAQWCVATANSLGSGMTSFDTLWYHMPFAAHFAQTGAVASIYFTQADPFVAYYPANSELLGAVGIIALHDDFLSPLLNLGWLALALLAAWCLGRPWRVSRLTLLSGCLVCSLPVLATTQPGEAFNDMMGLATLLAGVSLAANAPDDLPVLAVAGLALGLAAGTKYTFLVPCAVMVLALCTSARRGRRLRMLAALTLPALLTSALWYARDLIDVGNPLGLTLHVGPLRLPGPHSPLAEALQRTVISQLTHPSEWGSSFLPGLDHALGPLWPLILATLILAPIVGVVLVRDRFVRALAITAGLAAISYLLLPTGASSVPGVNVFEVNLRYVTPALALAIPLVPIIVGVRAPRALAPLAVGLLVILVLTQFEHALWPTQPARHLAFLAFAAIVVAVATHHRRLRGLGTARASVVAAVALLVLTVAAYAAQRRYLERRYRLGNTHEEGLGAIDRWAQTIRDSRIAVYGNLLQYPLVGPHDTNSVAYLGEAAPDGGFRPIESCRTWRRTLLDGRYRFLVLDYPGPTASLPIAWTAADPAMRLVMHPVAGTFLYRIAGTPHPSLCA